RRAPRAWASRRRRLRSPGSLTGRVSRRRSPARPPRRSSRSWRLAWSYSSTPRLARRSTRRAPGGSHDADPRALGRCVEVLGSPTTPPAQGRPALTPENAAFGSRGRDAVHHRRARAVTRRLRFCEPRCRLAAPGYETDGAVQGEPVGTVR